MAGKTGGYAINLEDDLLEHGDRYDFFQALRLLSRIESEKDPTAGAGKIVEKLRIHPELSLDHPVSDVAQVRRRESGTYEVLATFLGLYGVSSPLPSYYTEHLLNAEDEFDATTGSAARGFLDIVHHRLYPIFYQLWLKYRFSQNVFELRNGQYWNILFNLVGLTETSFRDSIEEPRQVLRYAGLFSQRQKSVVGLKTLVKGYLQSDDVEIVPCVEREVKIPRSQFSELGISNGVLGESATIGCFIKDNTGKFLIRVVSGSISHFEDFVHDRGIATRLKNLINFYLAQPLQADIVLVLDGDFDIAASIGRDLGSRLGLDTWLGGAPGETSAKVTLA